jgi:NAD(P)-dependent dehydrogenase (short-subunit alcohol dehydrogenase family)
MELDLLDRVVLVTGGSRGIGLATARAFVAEGARVALTYRDSKDAAEQAVAELGGGNRVMAVRYALDEPGSAEAAVSAVRARWGRVDVLVANAHRRDGRRGPAERFDSVDPQEWHGSVMDNLSAGIRAAQLVLPGMRERGWGRIVFLSSHVVRNGRPGQEFYAAAKSALHGLARSLAWETGQDGVLVNVVAPGLTLTEGVLTKLPSGLREGERAQTPTGRLSEPDEVARAVVFLGSGANGNVSGEVLHVSGGR